jgi:hypothetical protein
MDDYGSALAGKDQSQRPLIPSLTLRTPRSKAGDLDFALRLASVLQVLTQPFPGKLA